MYLVIIMLPLLGSIMAGFMGRKLGVTGTQIITCASVILTTILAVFAFFEVAISNISVYIKLFRWIDSESLNISWGFVFDTLTVSMLIPVLIVSSLVHLYSIGYMSHDPHNQRFFSYLSLFTFMMIILVTSNNFLLMFVGWEGVGVCSYLLVSFWFTRIAANQSSLSAFLTNRVGDCFLTIGIFAILWSFGNIEYSTVFSIAPFISNNIITLIGICLLIGAMAKSSQIGLHVWLPMAMEGPTPVSALIHAATMVTAGVYLLMRSSPLIEYSNTVLLLCLWIGAITTVFSSLIGLFQQDIKKVIAYSTMSQLAREFIIYNIFRHQAICVEFVKTNNSQITKARINNSNYLDISKHFLNSFMVLYPLFWLISQTEKWKMFIVSKLVGISEAIRLILTVFRSFAFYMIYSLYLNWGTNCLQIFMSNSCYTFKQHYATYSNADKAFNEWLSGLIDGDGYFSLSKKGSARLNITMDIRDQKALYEIQQKFGGSINKIANANALRYNLSNKKGLIFLINAVNGNIRNPTRMLQMSRLCVKYNIIFIFPKPLTFNNGWLSGFIDSDGSVYFNEASGQIFISISQKNIYLLEPLIHIYGGRIDPIGKKIEAFKYVIYRKAELFNLVDNYFNIYPLRSMKINRVNLIKLFFKLRIYSNTKTINDLVMFNEWIKFKDKWEKYIS